MARLTGLVYSKTHLNVVKRRFRGSDLVDERVEENRSGTRTRPGKLIRLRRGDRVGAGTQRISEILAPSLARLKDSTRIARSHERDGLICECRNVLELIPKSGKPIKMLLLGIIAAG